MELKLTQSSLPTPIFNTSSLFPKRFSLLTQRWNLDIQRITWKGHVMSKKILLHVVKEGETLSSISKMYGVPILEIAASNEEIADVNVVFEGQSLKIPSAAVAEWAKEFRLEQRLLRNGFPKLGFHQFPIARTTTGSFPILVTVVAFCIGCITGAFLIMLARKSRRKAAKKSPNSARWKTALRELRDPDTESALESDVFPDDKEQFCVEDASSSQHDNKLEGDYKKFLAECGMSNYGYWRGGSPQ